MSRWVGFRKNVEVKKLFGSVGERAESPAYVGSEVLGSRLDDDREYLDW